MIRQFVAVALLLLAGAHADFAKAQNTANGQALYQGYCATCHGPPFASARDAGAIRAAINGFPDMRFLSFLTDADLSDIAAWVSKELGAPPAPPPTANYTGLWYNFPAESEAGWGVNFTQQGDIVFGTLFTYDAGGAPLWLVMPAGQRQAGSDRFTGALYRTRGPAFNANPFRWDPGAPGNLTEVGTMTVAFTAADRATLTYTFSGATVTKTITKQVYGSRPASCVAFAGSRATAANYQDLWYNAPAESEPGWGVNVTHQDNTLFATLFTYDAAGRDLWLVMSDGRRQPDGTFSGDLFRTTGPAFNASPFKGIGVTPVGSMSFRFSDGENGTLTYTYQGVTVTKPITRQVFSTTLFRCE